MNKKSKFRTGMDAYVEGIKLQKKWLVNENKALRDRIRVNDDQIKIADALLAQASIQILCE